MLMLTKKILALVYAPDNSSKAATYAHAQAMEYYLRDLMRRHIRYPSDCGWDPTLDEQKFIDLLDAELSEYQTIIVIHNTSNMLRALTNSMEVWKVSINNYYKITLK